MENQKRLLNSKETAAYLRLAEQSLCNRRHLGLPPSFVRLGRRCLYEIEVLDEFIDKNRVKIED